MDEETKGAPYEDLKDMVDEYGHQKGEDLLTDPAAVAAAAEKVEHEVAADHAARLKASREERGFTLDELADRTGIDRETLAKVETGETFLPLGHLIKLSKVLSMRMADVISEGQEAFTIVRADRRQSVARFGQAKETKHGYEYASLAPGKKDRKMEPFIVTLYPASTDEASVHDGQEFIYVLEGEMEAVVGDTRDLLGPGDAIYYDSTTKHLVRAYGDKPAKILAVLIS